MVDHAFFAATDALKRAFTDALLERNVAEESLTTDLLVGDIAFETAYTLPGETKPARVQAEATLEWSAWSQAAHRASLNGDPVEEPPELTLELRLRVQRLVRAPARDVLLPLLPMVSPEVAGTTIERSGLAIEEFVADEGPEVGVSVEAIYEGIIELTDEPLDFAPLGGWVASTLVRLADLNLDFLPPEEDEQAD